MIERLKCLCLQGRCSAVDRRWIDNNRRNLTLLPFVVLTRACVRFDMHLSIGEEIMNQITITLAALLILAGGTIDANAAGKAIKAPN